MRLYKTAGYLTSLKNGEKVTETCWIVPLWCLQLANMHYAAKGRQRTFSDATKSAWLESLESFQNCVVCQSAGASLTSVACTKNGLVSCSSKLVAAEWFVKATGHYNKVEYA